MSINEWINNIQIDINAMGFAGELYLNKNDLISSSQIPLPMLELYFKFSNHSLVYNRSAFYYSSNIHEVVHLVERIPHDYEFIASINLDPITKRHILFTLVEYYISALCKLLDTCFYSDDIKNNYYFELHNRLFQSIEVLNMLIFKSEITKKIESIDFIHQLKIDILNTGINTLRTNIEMDNKLVLLLDFFAYYDVIQDYDLIVSIVFGGILIPPMYKSLSSLLYEQPNRMLEDIPYQLIKISKYDLDDDYESYESQMEYFKAYSPNVHVLLTDDCVGSAKTLLAAKQILNNHFKDVSLKAIEYHWEKKVRPGVNLEDTFAIEELKYLSPLKYRHYIKLNDYIQSLLMGDWSKLVYPYFPEYLKYYELMDLPVTPEAREELQSKILQIENIHQQMKSTEVYGNLLSMKGG
ncbi:phosphoribosyltransferase [Paenibacillus sp. 1011MAR3C5]|uniref:phosphoribosyltransferase n=1 Tax=Paenibacillus sp. 1011MAR3C5 TaxID=1675787 RepID=UPI000E6B8E33|nr:phosphoribosyltransferase [Paenibacillus sp. 1011MAR3C5]RJE89669.1 phosphoribosyltransferase [Paenibacillus sp. 1011MAR3C5]